MRACGSLARCGGARLRAVVLFLLLAVGVSALATRAAGQLPEGKESPVPAKQSMNDGAPGQGEPGSEEPVPPSGPDEGTGETGEGEDPWSPGGESSYGGYYEPVRREPPPILPARPLPFYPSEPPRTAIPGSAASTPPDFIGSAQGYLEIPVGQTATLLARGADRAATRDEKTARVVARERDRVLVRGLFPGRTLLDVWSGSEQRVYVVRVR